MACKCCRIGKDHIIADDAIVGNMHICHEQAVIPHNGFIIGFGTTINGHKFPDSGIIPDLNDSFLSVEFKVLRNGRYHGTGKDAAILANARAFHNGHMRANPGTFLHYYILFYIYEGLNNYILGNFSLWMYVC